MKCLHLNWHDVSMSDPRTILKTAIHSRKFSDDNDYTIEKPLDLCRSKNKRQKTKDVIMFSLACTAVAISPANYNRRAGGINLLTYG